MNKFCVYLHIDNNGDIFYVGQGTILRANKRCKGRSRKWQDKAKDGYDVLIVYDTLSKEEAVYLEKQTILKLRSQNQPLVNVSVNNGVRVLTREMFENTFEISDNSKYGLVWKRERKSHKNRGIDAGGLNKAKGYVDIVLNGKIYPAHRVVMALHLGECPSDLVVNHKNGVKTDNRLCNLELVTQQENVKHSYSAGLSKGLVGDKNHMAILSENDILKIYNLIDEGLSNVEIADIFKVGHNQISNIRRGNQWIHLFNRLGRTRDDYFNSKEKVKQAWLLVKECKLTNKEISEITSIEVSQVSRIRHRKTLVKWLDEFEEELAKQ